MEIKTRFDIGNKAYIQGFNDKAEEVEITRVDVSAYRDARGDLHVYESYQIKEQGYDRERNMSGDCIYAGKGEITAKVIESRRQTIREIEAEIAKLEESLK